MKKPGNAVLVLFVLVIKTSRKVKGDEVSHVSQNMGEDGYVYEYSVVDGDSSWMQSHGEWSDGISTHGSYNVKLPDGRIQKVIYTADEHGFRPVISYENPLKGYGLRNHVRLGGAEEHNSEREFTGRNVVRYKENDFDSEGWHEPIPPPFYEMTKLYDVPAHGPKGLRYA